MKTSYWVGGVLLAAVLATGLWFSMTGYNVAGRGDSLEKTIASNNAPSSGSLADLLKRGGSWQCDVSGRTGPDTTTGTVYVANGKMRGNFVSDVPHIGQVQSHMISDGVDVYVWTSAAPMGFKTKVDHATTEKSDENMYSKNYSYHCSLWTADSSLFVVPTDISFHETGAMTPSTTPETAKGAPSGMNCAMCDQAPAGESRTQCKAALHCK